MSEDFPFHQRLENVVLGFVSLDPSRGGQVNLPDGLISEVRQGAVETHERIHLELLRSTDFGCFQTIIAMMANAAAAESSDDHHRILSSALGDSISMTWSLQEGTATFLEYTHILDAGGKESTEEWLRTLPDSYRRAFEQTSGFATRFSLPPRARSNLVYQLARAALQTDILQDMGTAAHLLDPNHVVQLLSSKPTPDKQFADLLRTYGEEEHVTVLTRVIAEQFDSKWAALTDRSSTAGRYQRRADFGLWFLDLLRPYILAVSDIDLLSPPAKRLEWMRSIQADLHRMGLGYLDEFEFVDMEESEALEQVQGSVVLETKAESGTRRQVGALSELTRVIAASDAGYVQVGLGTDDLWSVLVHPYPADPSQLADSSDYYCCEAKPSAVESFLTPMQSDRFALVASGRDFASSPRIRQLEYRPFYVCGSGLHPWEVAPIAEGLSGAAFTRQVMFFGEDLEDVRNSYLIDFYSTADRFGFFLAFTAETAELYFHALDPLISVARADPNQEQIGSAASLPLTERIAIHRTGVFGTDS